MGPPATIEPPPQSAELEDAVNQAIAACGGDTRAAVRALIVAAGVCEAELHALQEVVGRLTAVVSHGYARGQLAPRRVPRDKA